MARQKRLCSSIRFNNYSRAVGRGLELSRRQAGHASAARHWPLQAILPPQQAVGHPQAPADVLSGDLAETMPELGLLKVDDVDATEMGTAVLSHESAGPALGCPVTLLQDHNDSAAA
ncbi:MAG: hypothetical protein EBZ48_03920 [Proteobacteria bacterium]|nr:hypothetical protein [Pseudomonadota bacterium]